jgi:hypothetical protein
LLIWVYYAIQYGVVLYDAENFIKLD